MRSVDGEARGRRAGRRWSAVLIVCGALLLGADDAGTSSAPDAGRAPVRLPAVADTRGIVVHVQIQRMCDAVECSDFSAAFRHAQTLGEMARSGGDVILDELRDALLRLDQPVVGGRTSAQANYQRDVCRSHLINALLTTEKSAGLMIDMCANPSVSAELRGELLDAMKRWTWSVPESVVRERLTPVYLRAACDDDTRLRNIALRALTGVDETAGVQSVGIERVAGTRLLQAYADDKSAAFGDREVYLRMLYHLRDWRPEYLEEYRAAIADERTPAELRLTYVKRLSEWQLMDDEETAEHRRDLEGRTSETGDSSALGRLMRLLGNAATSQPARTEEDNQLEP